MSLKAEYEKKAAKDEATEKQLIDHIIQLEQQAGELSTERAELVRRSSFIRYMGS